MKLQRRINNLEPIIFLNYPQFYAFYHGPDLMGSYQNFKSLIFSSLFITTNSDIGINHIISFYEKMMLKKRYSQDYFIQK